ncbi:MAG: preprotein translocase subunit YajC [Carnobacterium sp.]|uniref:preprotein translocase subunit YajC n=1 Tax=Carnobacterium sp. TaxID=48221 RepID=UPI003C732E33
MEFIISILPFAAIMGLMYFMMIRPQKKAADKTKDMLASMKKGDGVVTIGGLHGIIDELNEADKTVVINCEGIFLTFERRAIARIKDLAAVATVETFEVESEDNELV